MALVFGRFDKAPANVREALLDFVAATTKEERRAAAMSVFEAANGKEPDITSKDLTRVVRDLFREARILGFIGRNVNVMQLSLQFQHLITPRPGWNGLPQGTDQILTLAEISVLQLAAPHNHRCLQGDEFNR